MKSRKVQELIHVLTLPEREGFISWLKIRLNGKQHKTIEMAAGLINSYPVKKLWRAAYPEKPFPDNPYQDSGFRRLEFQVSQQLETFLALQRIQDDQPLLKLSLLEELKKRGADRIFVNSFNRTKRELQQEKKLDSSLYEHLYRLEREWRDYLLKQGRKKELPDNSSSLNFLMDAWWFHEKMRASLMNLNDDTAGSEEQFVRQLILLIKESDKLSSLPLLTIYCDLYEMLTTQDVTMAPRIQAWLVRHVDDIQEDISQDIFNILHNYYVRHFNRSGDEVFVRSLWDLYQWGIKSEILIHEGVLSPGRYRNLIETGLRIGELELVWDYLTSLKSKLPEESRDEEYRFNLGGYYAAKGDLSMARRTLGSRFSHPHKEVNARMKLLRLRYEEGEREDLDYELRALREFCRRNGDMNPVFRQNAVNEIKMFQALSRAYLPADFEKLKKRIEETSPLVSRPWFTEQVNSELT